LSYCLVGDAECFKNGLPVFAWVGSASRKELLLLLKLLFIFVNPISDSKAVSYC
jgi:predicted MFS family arabinose efflux permease